MIKALVMLAVALLATFGLAGSATASDPLADPQPVTLPTVTVQCGEPATAQFSSLELSGIVEFTGPFVRGDYSFIVARIVDTSAYAYTVPNTPGWNLFTTISPERAEFAYLTSQPCPVEEPPAEEGGNSDADGDGVVNGQDLDWHADHGNGYTQGNHNGLGKQAPPPTTTTTACKSKNN